jgi:hypothetical protein
VTPPPSENLLHRLARMNPTVAFLTSLALLLAGLFLPGIIGGALLFLLAAGLAALTFTTWPVQTPQVRAVRAIMLVLLFGVAVLKII